MYQQPHSSLNLQPVVIQQLNKLVCYFLAREEFERIRGGKCQNRMDLEEIIEKLVTEDDEAENTEDKPLDDGGRGRLTTAGRTGYSKPLSRIIAEYFGGENPQLGYISESGMVVNATDNIIEFVDNSMLKDFTSAKDNVRVFVKLDNGITDVTELNDL